MNYLCLVLAIVAALLLGEFAVKFAEWNKMQACATTGGRNCGTPRVYLSH